MARHPFDALSFLFGLVFAAVGLLLLAGSPARGTIALDWAGPVVAVGLGLVVLLAAFRRPSSEEDPASNPAEIEP
jgi:cytochrome c-type biogenesis protein CcmH/NrfF